MIVIPHRRRAEAFGGLPWQVQPWKRTFSPASSSGSTSFASSAWGRKRSSQPGARAGWKALRILHIPGT
jgi:hypothetical protein